MGAFEFFKTALQSALLNKWRTFLTTLGIVIGVYSVVILVSLGEGAKMYFVDLFTGMGSNLLIIFPGKKDTKGGTPHPVINTVRKLSLSDIEFLKKRGRTFDSVNGIIMGGGTTKYMNRQRDLMIVGTNETFSHIHNIPVERGTFISSEDVSNRKKVAVIGHTVLKELFYSENPLGKQITVAGGRFTVIGIMQSKGQSLGIDMDDIVYIPLTVAMDIFNQEGLTRITVKANSASNIEASIEEIRDLMKKAHNGNEDFTIISQKDMLTTFEKIAATMQLVVLGIASISLLVGGIGIMNIMLVTVKEKTREIGIRIAVGARRIDILIQFLIESVTISLLGGLIGLLLGLITIITFNSIVPDFQVRITPWIFMLSFSFSVVVGVIFGVFPAKRAANMNPIDALRYE
ncbi:MAG: ABC transporter permease [Deltaproteobacteria bacterium]|nr:ABC transporter permease [Deltaproteobacteria bacterium]